MLNKIFINNAEKCLLNIDAPKSDVSITIKSVHDSGYIRSNSLTLYILDEVAYDFNLVDVNSYKQIIPEGGDEGLVQGPTIFLDCPVGARAYVLTKFEILKLQIENKIKIKSEEDTYSSLYHL